MNKSIVINMVKGFAKNLSDDEVLEYEKDLMKIIREQKQARGLK